MIEKFFTDNNVEVLPVLKSVEELNTYVNVDSRFGTVYKCLSNTGVLYRATKEECLELLHDGIIYDYNEILYASSLSDKASFVTAYKCMVDKSWFYRTSLHECICLLQSGIVDGVIPLPAYKYRLPSGIPMYNAFDVSVNIANGMVDTEIFYPYLAEFIRVRNDIFTDAKSDELLFHIISSKLRYDYESNLCTIEQKFDHLNIDTLHDNDVNFLAFRVIILYDSNKIFVTKYATSKREAKEKCIVYRSTKSESI